MRSKIDVVGSKNGPKTEQEANKTKIGRHAEFTAPAQQKQGSGTTKINQNRRNIIKKGVRKTTLHSEAFFCRFFDICQILVDF